MTSYLIIDDDIDFANMIATAVTSWGYQSVVCHNWLTAMLKLKTMPIDVLIADVETPTGNGISVIDFLSSDTKVAKMEKAFVTGLSDETTKRKIRDLDSHYFHKSSDLMGQLKEFCDQCSQRLQTKQVAS